MGRINELLQHALSKKDIDKIHPVASVIYTEAAGETYYVLGWNGIPSLVEDTKKELPEISSREDYKQFSIHAEKRAISRAARYGIQLDSGTIYLSEWFPCADCARSITEAGLVKIVTPDEIYLDKEKHILVPGLQNNQDYRFEAAERMMRLAGIEMIVDRSIRP